MTGRSKTKKQTLNFLWYYITMLLSAYFIRQSICHSIVVLEFGIVAVSVWKLIHNSYPVGDRIKYFAPIQCPSCNNPQQDRNHFLLDCSTSRWLWSFINNKTNLFISFKTWNDCFLKTFNEGSFKENIIPATTLTLIIYELHYSHMKKTYDSFTPSSSHIINSFKHRFNIQTQVIQNLSLGKKVKTGFRKLNDKFNS